MKTELKTKLVSLLLVTIMLCSIFTGAVSADVKDTSENNLSDNTCYTLSQSATPLNNDSLNSEINRLLDANKPVFVFFYADWCHFCDEQKPIIAELEQEYADKIAFFRVNAEENPQAMNEFAVTEFPAMFLIVDKNAEGYLYQEFEGFTDKETLKEGFDFVIENGSLPENFDKTSSLFNQPDSENFSIASQEILTFAEFKAELANDSEFEELHDYARELGYFYPFILTKTTFDDSSFIVNAMMVSNDNDSLFLTKSFSDNQSYSMLMKIDNESITLFDKDGGTRIAVNGSVSSWDRHNSCSKAKCRAACIGLRTIISFVTILKNVAFSEDSRHCITCAQLCTPQCLQSIRNPALITVCITCVNAHCPDCVKALGVEAGKQIDSFIKKVKECDRECEKDSSAYWYPGINCKNGQVRYICGEDVSGEFIRRLECINCDWVSDYGISTRCKKTEKCVELYGQETSYMAEFPNVEFDARCVPKGCTVASECYIAEKCWIGECKGFFKTCKYSHRDCTDDDKDTVDSCDAEKGCVNKKGKKTGNNHPDDSYSVCSASVSQNTDTFNPDIRPEVAVLLRGYAYELQDLLASFNEPVDFIINEDFSPEDIRKNYQVFIIPSGALYGIDAVPSFRSKLEQYVSDGGTLIVFPQPYGYEFNAVPGNPGGYGWSEDQSCHHRSVAITTYHPILSGQDSVTLDVVVDGYFTSYPENATILLTRTKNGMPSMLMYEYGFGRVIATTAFTDWAYSNRQATKDGVNIVRDMVAWAKSLAEVPTSGTADTVNIPVYVMHKDLPLPAVEHPEYEPGDTINIPVNITNHANSTSEKVAFSIFDPDYGLDYVNVSASIPPNETKTVNFTYETTESSKTGAWFITYVLYNTTDTAIDGGYVGGFTLGIDLVEEAVYNVSFTLKNPEKKVIKQENRTASISPGELKIVNFTYTNPSMLGIHHLQYEVWDNDTLVDSDVRRVAVSKYAENPGGWIYQGKDITFSVSSDNDEYACGSNATFTIHIWNNGDIDKNITVYWEWIHEGRNLLGTFLVPAHDSISIPYTYNVYSRWGIWRFWTYFYDDGKYLGESSVGGSVFSPSVNIDIETDKQEYAKGEDVSLLLNLTNKQKISHNVTVTVRTLDPDNKKIYEERFDANLSAYASANKTLDFTLHADSKHGMYIVTAEAYENGDKIGSNSTYFEIPRFCLLRVSFDKPDKVYGIRQNLSLHLYILNPGSSIWSSWINTTIPAFSFFDSKFVSLNPNENREIEYKDFSISTDFAPGKYDVFVDVSYDNSTLKDYFFIPCSDLRIEVGKKYNAGENFSFNISNVGGVDTAFNCSFKFRDWKRGKMIYEDVVEDTVLSLNSKTISFEIPNQSVNGLYYLIVSCKDKKTGKETALAAKCEASGLKAALISDTERRVYFKNENVSILTNITNQNGEIVNGTLNLKIVRVSISNPTKQALARATAELSATHSSSKNSSHNNLVPQPLSLSLPATNSSHSPNLHNLIATARAVSSPANVTPAPEPSPEDEFNESNDNVDTTVLRAPGLTCTCGDICVNGTGWWRDGGDFNASGTPIQAAVDNATAGDMICVRDGNYNENVDVNKAHLTIRSENGSANCTVNASNPGDYVFEVTVNYVNVSGFTIEGATGAGGYYAGIYIDDYIHNCMISNNTIVNNNYGIWLHKSNHNNTLTNNNVSTNTIIGISLYRSCTNNRLTNNIASGNQRGISLYSSSNYNALTNNTANSNAEGIYLSDSHNNTLTSNTANSNTRWNGIIVINSNDNVLERNTCLDNAHGIRLDESNRNRLERNNCSNNYHGFEIQSSRYNTIRNNIANENSEHGMYIFRYWATDPRSAFNTLINNNVSKNTKDGIKLANDAPYNNFTDNNVSLNKNDGISLGLRCDHNNLAGNTVNGNSRYGIWVESTQYNNLTRNTVNANTGRGIYIRGSSNNNMLYNNYFNNTNNAYDEGHNIWNITKTLGTNIIGGPWLGGNYWSDYAGEDSDGDGLGDTLLPYNCSGMIKEGGDYLPLVMQAAPKEVLWEENITINLAEGETENIISEVPASVFKDVTGKQKLSTTFYSNTTQIINISDPFFYVTPKNTSLTLETDKRVYKPNETVLIYGEVKNHASIPADYNLSVKKDSVEIFNDSFTLATDETRYYRTNTSADASFTLEGTVDGVVVLDSLSVDSPGINASIIAPDVVGIKDFDVGVLIENIGNISADLNVSLDGKRWNITVPEGELQLLETSMNTSRNMTITVIISGDVNETIQKEIICGENAKINITPEPTYLEGEAEIPFTINNTGVLDSEFNATFSISSPDNQTITKHFFVPKEENISDSISFNLTKGAHLLRYTSPFETVNTTINVLSPPEFIVASIHPAELNFTIGENVTLVFRVKNIGGSEGEAALKLSMIDFEDTNRTWIRAGAEENISFYFSIPDDLEEKSYKGIYVLAGTRSEFTFFVRGAKISVDASLDKSMYAEGDTAVLTLELTNECKLDLDLYSRVKFNEYDSVQNFTLSGSGTETLVFYLPANFSGDNKVLYTVYMDSGRALYINSIYIYEELPDAPLRLFTEKDVYNMGEEVTIHIVDVTGTDMLNLTAPNFSYNDTISGPTTLEFTLPELRSGTYYIEYSFGNFSSTHPFDVRGYFARILEASLDKEEYISGNEMKLELNIEANRDVSGLLKTWIYDPEENLIDEFEMNKRLIAGENKIELCRTLSTNKSGIHAIVYGFSAELSGDSSTTLVSGAEYFDAESVGLCGDVAPYPDCNGIVDMGDVILLLNNVSYPEDPRYALCNDWAGDCRCTGVRDMGDVILLLNYVSYPEDPRYVLDCC